MVSILGDGLGLRLGLVILFMQQKTLLRDIATILTVSLLLVPLYAQKTKTSSSALPLTTITVPAAVTPMLRNYHQWAAQHPELWRDGSQLTIHFPVLFFYSSKGVLIHYGADPQQNVTFLSKLPDEISHQTADAPPLIQPSLAELVSMIPELRSHSQTVLRSNRFTAFSITYAGPPGSTLQRNAIRNLKHRTLNGNLSIVEVELRNE